MKMAAHLRPVIILFYLLFAGVYNVFGSSPLRVTYNTVTDTVVSTSTGLGYLSMSACAGIIKEQAGHRGHDTSYAILLDRTVETGRVRFFVFDLTGFTIIKYGFADELQGTATVYRRHHIPIFSVRKSNEGLMISCVTREFEKQTEVFALK